jgi:hypothetical protein
VLRIHFTEDDLARIRISAEPDPMWETLLSLHMLQERETPPMYAAWRTRVVRHLDPSLRPLLALAPPKGYSPDFLALAQKRWWVRPAPGPMWSGGCGMLMPVSP